MSGFTEKYFEMRNEEIESIHRNFLAMDIEPTKRYNMTTIKRNNGAVNVRKYINWLGFDIHYLKKYKIGKNNDTRIVDISGVDI